MPNGNSQQIYPYLAEIMAAQQALVMGLERVVAVVGGAAHIQGHRAHLVLLDMVVVLAGLLEQMQTSVICKISQIRLHRNAGNIRGNYLN